MTSVTHPHRNLTGLLKIRVFCAPQVALNRFLYGFVVPVVIVWLVIKVVPVEPLRLACAATVIATGFMLMRVPAVTFTEEQEAGLYRLLMQTGHARPADIQLSLFVSVIALACLPALSFFVVLFFTSAELDVVHLVPLILLCVWFFGLGLCLLAFQLSLIAVQLLADILIVAIVVFCPIFYSVADGSGAVLAVLSALPPTLFLTVANGIEISGTPPVNQLIQLFLWALGTLLAGLIALRRRL